MVVSLDLHVLLTVVVGLQIKHLVVDFFLQTPYMYLNKGTFGHPGGIVHSAFHAIVTMAILLSLPITYGWLLLIGLVEFVIHYMMDWFKVWHCRRRDYNPQTPRFWEWLGIDQFVHQVNYVFTVIVCIWVGAFAPPA